MSLALRRSAVKKNTVAHGLSRSLTQEPVHRTFSTSLTSHPVRHQALLRYVIARRAFSYSSIPKFVIRAFRVPVAGATVGVGGIAYANYRFEGSPQKSNGFLL